MGTLAAAVIAGGSTIAVPTATAAPTGPSIGSFTATLSDTNLITLAWNVSGGDASNLLYVTGVGFRPQNCAPAGQPAGCSTQVRVNTSGIHEYTLLLRDDPNNRINATAQVSVARLEPPVVWIGPETSDNGVRSVHVDEYDVQPQTMHWGPAPGAQWSPNGFIELTKAGSIFPIGSHLDGLPGTKFALTGSREIPVVDLADGSGGYSAKYCIQPAANQPALCSSPRIAQVSVGGARFGGDYRRFVPSGQDVTLTWGGAGNVWFVSAPSLGIATFTSTPSMTVPSSQLSAGIHRVDLVTCSWGVIFRCDNRADVKAPAAGTLDLQLADGATYWKGLTSAIGTVTPVGGGSPVEVASTAIGNWHPEVADGASVTEGQQLGYVISGARESVEIVVGDGPEVPTWTTRDWNDDFTGEAIDTGVHPGSGSPLDVNFDSAGDVWVLGEFTTGVVRASQGSTEFFEAPLQKVWDQAKGQYVPSKPYGSLFSSGSKTHVSGAGERVIDTGAAVWFTHGGTSASSDNYTRLIRFDRNATDDPTTDDDERLCAVHVPGAGAEGYGLAYDSASNRVWFSAQRVFEGSGTGSQSDVVGWVIDGEQPCNNSLNYDDPAQVAAADAANTCDTESQVDCVHQVPLPEGTGAPAHLAVDNASGYLWIVDFTGQYLNRMSLTTGAIESFALPAPTRPGIFGMFPWQIRVDGDAVYMGAYGDSRLIRFDKTVPNPATACADLVDGQNPCISVIPVPMQDPEVNIHSIALHGDRLYFTVANETGNPRTPDASYFGYVDVDAWAAGTPTGVVYTGFGTLGPADPLGEGTHHSFRGIEVNAAGVVALADMRYRNVDLLTPKPQVG